MLTRTGWIQFYTDKCCGGRVFRVKHDDEHGFVVEMRCRYNEWRPVEYMDSYDVAVEYYLATVGTNSNE